MDFATLKALDLAEFETAADGYRTAGATASSAKDSLERQIVIYMRRELKGEALDQAVKQLFELAKNFHYAEVECGLLRTSLNALAAELRTVKKRLDAAVEDAEEIWKFTVHSDGSVSYPAAGDKVDGKTPAGGTVTGRPLDIESSTPDELFRDVNGVEEAENARHPNPNHAAAVNCANRIAQAVADATEIDEKWAPKLRQLKADDDLTVSDGDWLDAKRDMGGVREAAKESLTGVKIPSEDSDPVANAQWWKGLSEEEKDSVVSLYPASVGALEGLPVDIRDQANRTVLAEAHADVSQKLHEFYLENPEPTKKGYRYNDETGLPVGWTDTTSWNEWDKKRSVFTNQIKGMDAIFARFERVGEDGLPEAYLLDFSHEGNGRAIIANGNPDTAEHVAVYDPGTTARLDKIEGDINRGVNLWKASDSLTSQKVSTITWLGYDAPQDLVWDASRSSYADDGAAAYNKFIDGLNAANLSGADSHITSVGHSYGSTLIGSAARQHDLNVDDIVFAGSPGVQVANAVDLDVAKGHVWNEEADGDKVPELGGVFHGGTNWKRSLDAGIIPSDDAFGANQMATDTEGHSGYWDYDDDKGKPSLSLLNQARVITGLYGEVKLKDSGGSWREPGHWGE